MTCFLIFFFSNQGLKGQGKKSCLKDNEEDFNFFLFFSTFLFKGGGKDQELLLQKVFSIILFWTIKNVICVGRTFWQNWWQLFLCPKVTICTFLWCSLFLTHPHSLLYSLLGAFLKSIVTKWLDSDLGCLSSVPSYANSWFFALGQIT